MAKVKVNVVEKESEQEYCLTLESMDEGEIFRCCKFATINLGYVTVKFQLDSGAACNLLPTKYLEDRKELMLTRKWLTMYNDTII